MSDLTELRDSCLDCVRKHLSQALVLMQEVHQGYPEHRWIAVGHLGEAADEAVKDYPDLAEEIRKHRVRYMKDPKYAVPCLELIEKASKLVKESCGTKCAFKGGVQNAGRRPGEGYWLGGTAHTEGTKQKAPHTGEQRAGGALRDKPLVRDASGKCKDSQWGHKLHCSHLERSPLLIDETNLPRELAGI